MSDNASPAKTRGLPRDSAGGARAYWDSVARQWVGARPHALWRRHSDAVNAALLTEWLPAGGDGLLLKTDLFDEAVSDGMRRVLSSLSWRWFGVDISAEIVRAANGRGGVSAGIAADVLRLPFADESIDAVVSLSTVDHLPGSDSVQRALSEMCRVLKPGHPLIITIDNSTNPAIALRRALPQAWLQSVGILPYSVGPAWSAGRLRRALRHEPLQIAAQTSIMHCPRAIAVWRADRLACAHLDACDRFLLGLMHWESLARWPTRWLTGHFVAALAVKE